MVFISLLFLNFAFAHSPCLDPLSAIRPQVVLATALKRSHTKFETAPAYSVVKKTTPVGMLIAPSLWDLVKSEHFTLHVRPASTLTVSATSIFQNLGLYDAVIYTDKKEKIEAVLLHPELLDWKSYDLNQNDWSFNRFTNELPLAMKTVLLENKILKLTHRHKLPLLVRKLATDELPPQAITAAEFKTEIFRLLNQVTETNSPVFFKIQGSYVGVYPDSPEFN